MCEAERRREGNRETEELMCVPSLSPAHLHIHMQRTHTSAQGVSTAGDEDRRVCVCLCLSSLDLSNGANVYMIERERDGREGERRGERERERRKERHEMLSLHSRASVAGDD